MSHCLTEIPSRARRALPLALLAGAAALGGCFPRPGSPPPRPEPPAAQPLPELSPWPGTLAAALRAAEAGRYEDADSVLLDFGVKHAGKPEGAESDFWRALFKSDPANRRVTVREQLALLDNYLGLGPSAPRYAEATILRRMVEAGDSTRALVQTMRASSEARERLRDEEIRRLNELYDRTSAELERIKRRLAPKP
jgi:hypothetical protein